jgi:hypothetical protein
MMGEFREHLDEEARRVSARSAALEDVKRRAGRRRIRRQVATGVLALVIAAGSFLLAVTAFRGPGSARPAVGPAPSVSPAARVRLLDGANDPEAIDIIRELINKAGYQVLQEGPAGHAYETTTIACPPAFDDEAARMAHQLDVDAAIVPAIPHPDYDLTLYVGEDLALFEHERVLTWIGRFVEARRNGDAERFLAPSAREDYFETSGRTEPRFGELYLYPEQEIVGYLVPNWYKVETDTWAFDLRLVLKSPCPSGFERITIAAVGDGRYELTSASLAGAPVSDCPAT